jgi:hypothetical protein
MMEPAVAARARRAKRSLQARGTNSTADFADFAPEQLAKRKRAYNSRIARRHAHKVKL